MKETILEGHGLCKDFFGGGKLFYDLEIAVYKGDFTVIMGPSGAGKSTLLYALSGIDNITGGTVNYKGRPITGLSEEQMSTLRAKEFGFVFQQTHLVSNLTLLENVTVAGYLAGKELPETIQARAGHLLHQMGVEGAKDRLPTHVSGGEAQRAAIARAMIGDPCILFADEPTGALNRQSSREVLDLLTGLNQQGQSILMVTHDARAAARGNRILYLEDGKILDELTLSPYEKPDQKREEQANRWLSALRW